jgi:uncharacterized surface protein with fasciclin (FAS1) repeats
MTSMRRFAICLLVMIFHGHARAEEEKAKAPPAVPLPEALVQVGCTIMARVIDTAGLRDKLREAGPFTCFAPTDEAFRALPEAELKAFLDPARREQLARWAGYHIVAEDMTGQDLMRARRLPTLAGAHLTVWVSKGRIQLDRKATLVRRELPASNGIIHTLDRLLDPPPQESNDKDR